MSYKLQELIKTLNEMQILNDNDWEENIPEEIYNEFFLNSGEVDSDLDIDKHRWFETSLTVVSLVSFPKAGFIGIRHVSKTFSTDMGTGDCGHILHFVEMEQVKVTSYKEKIYE